jgi:hypothetical protein
VRGSSTRTQTFQVSAHIPHMHAVDLPGAWSACRQLFRFQQQHLVLVCIWNWSVILPGYTQAAAECTNMMHMQATRLEVPRANVCTFVCSHHSPAGRRHRRAGSPQAHVTSGR